MAVIGRCVVASPAAGVTGNHRCLLGVQEGNPRLHWLVVEGRGRYGMANTELWWVLLLQLLGGGAGGEVLAGEGAGGRRSSSSRRRRRRRREVGATGGGRGGEGLGAEGTETGLVAKNMKIHFFGLTKSLYSEVRQFRLRAMQRKGTKMVHYKKIMVSFNGMAALFDAYCIFGSELASDFVSEIYFMRASVKMFAICNVCTSLSAPVSA